MKAWRERERREEKKQNDRDVLFYGCIRITSRRKIQLPYGKNYHEMRTLLTKQNRYYYFFIIIIYFFI